MPYTTPSTVTGSDVLTAALWNTQIRDNLEFFRKPQNACVVCVASATAVAANTGNPYNTLLYDTGTGTASWTIGDPTKLYVRETGLYRVSFFGEMFTSVAHNINATETPYAQIKRHPTTTNLVAASMACAQNGSTTSFMFNVSATLSLTAGDSLISQFTLPNGGTATLRAAVTSATTQLNTVARFQIEWVGATS